MSGLSYHTNALDRRQSEFRLEEEERLFAFTYRLGLLVGDFMIWA